MRTPVLTLTLMALLGCASNPNQYHFKPDPIEILAPEGAAAATLRALISVRGARAFEGDGPLEMHLRLRVENLGEADLALVSDRLHLLSADLLSFGPARMHPGHAALIEGGGEQLYDLYFPFPSPGGTESLDLGALNLRLGLDNGRELYLLTATFERVHYYRRRMEDGRGLFLSPGLHFHGEWSVGTTRKPFNHPIQPSQRMR